MNIPPSNAAAPGRARLVELAALCLRLGFTAFGGPAAHIAMLHNEVVERRRWLTEEHFLDLLGATNLIPGPNSTEMVIHVGFVRAGWIGLIVAGMCFITPAMLIVLALAWAYVSFGSLPAADALLYGIKPVVIAVVLQALWGLGQKAVKGPLTALVGLAALALYFLHLDNVALMVGGGVLVMLIANRARLLRHGDGGQAALAVPLLGAGLPLLAAAVRPFGLGLLFFTFLKIGSVLYGSGYTLLAFLQTDFVDRLGWLTTRQIIDAVAVGQVTPGPVFTTATFIGYVLGGLPGGLLATLGIFLPAFVFVALSSPLIPRIRQSTWAAGFLDGVNVAALGLMAAVTIQLARAAFVDWIAVTAAAISAVLLLRFKVNTTWLIAGGALVGIAVLLLR